MEKGALSSQKTLKIFCKCSASRVDTLGALLYGAYMERDKKRYTMEYWDEDGQWHILNPWNGCSIYHGDKEKVARILAEHNGEQYQPEF